MPEENGRTVPTPVRAASADAGRAKLAELLVYEADVADAVVWTRRKANAPVVRWDGDPTGTSIEHDALYDESELTDTPGGR